MRATDAQPRLETEQANAMWNSVVAQVPTVFGKLLWAASFRVLGSDRYRHPALEQIFSPEVTSRVLAASHRHYFESWLLLGLQKQHDDFTEYIEALPFVGRPRAFLDGLVHRLMPPSTIEPQRLLFDTDLAVVLELLDN